MRFNVKVVDGLLKITALSDSNATAALVEELRIDSFVLGGKRVLMDDANVEKVNNTLKYISNMYFETTDTLAAHIGADIFYIVPMYGYPSSVPFIKNGILIKERFFEYGTDMLSRYIPCVNAGFNGRYFIGRQSETELAISFVDRCSELIVNLGVECQQVWDTLQLFPRLAGNLRIVNIRVEYGKVVLTGPCGTITLTSYDTYNAAAANGVICEVSTETVLEIADFCLAMDKRAFESSPMKITDLDEVVTLTSETGEIVQLPMPEDDLTDVLGEYVTVSVTSGFIILNVYGKSYVTYRNNTTSFLSNATTSVRIDPDKFLDLLYELYKCNKVWNSKFIAM